ncbi:MAG: MAPEG family protein, partial [Candidatus Binatia bacterium]
GYTVHSEEPPEVQRAHRLHRNDLENIPAFFAIGLIYVLMGASAFGAQMYFISFTVARILHTITYLAQMQPWRTITFAVGFLSMLGITIQVLLAAL